MARVKQNLLLLAANLLIPLSVLIFFTGFFRGSPRTSTRHESEMSEIQSARSDSAPFDKVAFMMIDALRRFEIFFQCSAFATFDIHTLADRLALPHSFVKNEIDINTNIHP